MVAIKPPIQIKMQGNLKQAVQYILNSNKTTIKSISEIEENFPIVIKNGEHCIQLVSGHQITDVSIADEEMIMTKRLAAIEKGDDDFKEIYSGKQVLAHHIIQSFSPDDHLTPEQVHEIGRRTMLEFTGGDYEFVIATHVDKNHLHNHIIVNTTNSVTMKKMRWQKNTLKKLRAISDKQADLYGAKIIQPTMKNSHKKYAAWRRQNNFRFEIKERLDFLLKQSISMEDFKMKAKALDVQIDFSGKYVKYRLLTPLDGKLQERNTRDDTLSKKGIYSLENIQKRIRLNQVVYDVSEIRERYQNEKEKTEIDFELKLEVEAWQVESETTNGIYLQMDYGVFNSGTILIPAHKVDKLENGNYHIFLKEKDYFYLMNPDHSEKNRYMMGTTVAKQLAKQNGQVIVTKNPYISSMKELIQEFNFLVDHDVRNGKQFDELEERFNQKIKETDQELKKLDDRLVQLRKIEGAFVSLETAPENSLVASRLLEELVKPGTKREDIQQLIQQLTIEKGVLREHFEDTLKNYTNYQEVKQNVLTRKELSKSSQEKGQEI
ncbi:relaxase/mobilization nuclease domain-containing protein [Streptococcus sp. SI1]|uniref:relaxase/mobilization nuclease domain-containing protein n=1 Tax=Streptococcus sp. SI1 TaxID=3018245 RepID=UPI00263BF24E|nr:relaxase/mobilization nuclease domain-containing protein [Streptococcus sp. SI1]MDN5016677.1 relaxase/mobilization nuclease domain-containing protein [Streptococcus sp. SI1]